MFIKASVILVLVALATLTSADGNDPDICFQMVLDNKVMGCNIVSLGELIRDHGWDEICEITKKEFYVPCAADKYKPCLDSDGFEQGLEQIKGWLEYIGTTC